MKILVIGGTVFLGRHFTEASLERGHEVTLFNRGKSNPELFPHVEQIHGDRGENLNLLEGRRWDAVLDTCGFFPRVVRLSAEALKDSVDRYVFISSISVYAKGIPIGSDETAPLGRIEDTTIEEITAESYGPLKALCEEAVEEVLQGRTLVIRPGLIVGPNDPSDRFTYWPKRAAAGGEILGPGSPDAPIQVIDVRDLAAWTLDLIEKKQTGIYNATGPEKTLTVGEVVETSVKVAGAEAKVTWIPDQFLLEKEVGPWMEMPLWIPGIEPTMQVNLEKPLEAGLRFRPLEETIEDTLKWAETAPEREPRAGLAREKESKVLADWHASQE